MKKCLIFVIAVALVVAFTMPASAASKVSFSGMANFITLWDKDDAIRNGSNFNDTDMTWDEDGQTSRFAARFSDGPITGLVEFGMGSRINAATISVRTRHIYGEYDFGNFKFLVGQTYEASFMPFLWGFRGGQGGYRGEATIGTRTPMIRVRTNVGPGELKVAGIYNKGGAYPTGFLAAATRENDITMPKLEVAYKAKFGNFGVNLCGSWQTYDIVQISTNKDWDITSYGLMAKVDTSFGPLSLAGGLYTGENLGNHGMGGALSAGWDGVNQRILDADQFGWSLGAKYTITPMFYFAAGYGETNMTRPSAVAGQTEFEDDSSGYTMHLGISVAKNFDMKLGYAVRDEEDTRAAGAAVATDEGKRKYWGAT
jgi:hypothetical protein